MTNITETEALSKVAGYCSTAEHCRAEISEKLQRWGLPYDAIDRILKRLEDETDHPVAVLRGFSFAQVFNQHIVEVILSVIVIIQYT